MTRCPCKAYDGQYCVMQSLLPTVGTLQRRAYIKMYENIFSNMSCYLPAQLAHIVFEHALAAEGVPLDPRVFVMATHVTNGREGLKTKLVCPHWVRGKGGIVKPYP
jgi:hypothetical protein